MKPIFHAFNLSASYFFKEQFNVADSYMCQQRLIAQSTCSRKWNQCNIQLKGKTCKASTCIITSIDFQKRQLGKPKIWFEIDSICIIKKNLIFVNHCHSKNERGPSSVCKKQPFSKISSIRCKEYWNRPPPFLHFKDFYISVLNVLYWLN